MSRSYINMSRLTRANSKRSSKPSGEYESPPPMRYRRSTKQKNVTKRASTEKRNTLPKEGDALLNPLNQRAAAPLPSFNKYPWLNSPFLDLFINSCSKYGFPATRLRSPQAEDPSLSQYVSFRTSTPAPDSRVGLGFVCDLLCQKICAKQEVEGRRRLFEGSERRNYGTV